MESEYLGTNIITYSEKLVEDTYSVMYKNTLKFMLRHCIFTGFLGVLLVLGDIFIDYFHTSYIGIFFITLAFVVFVNFFKSKRNVKNNILNSYKANNNKVTTVIYYEDKIHISSKWNRGYSEYDIRYSDISIIYLSNKTMLFLYNYSTQMLNIIEETLEGVNAEQIIQKIKSSNVNLKIIKN